MKEETQKLAKKLNKFSKEQIIRAISEDYRAAYYVESLIDNLEYRSQQELLDKHSAAIDAEQAAAQACMGWRREMCEKYGHGGQCKLVDIPDSEIQKGARLEKEWKAARDKENAVSKQVDKALGIGKERRRKADD